MPKSLKLIMFAGFFSQKFVMHHSVYISVRTLNKYSPACLAICCNPALYFECVDLFPFLLVDGQWLSLLS